MPGSIYIVINARVVLERGLEYANIPHIVHGTTPFMFGRSVNVLCKLIGIELEDDGGGRMYLLVIVLSVLMFPFRMRNAPDRNY